jgi:hypothetical protein
MGKREASLSVIGLTLAGVLTAATPSVAQPNDARSVLEVRHDRLMIVLERYGSHLNRRHLNAPSEFGHDQDLDIQQRPARELTAFGRGPELSEKEVAVAGGRFGHDPDLDARQRPANEQSAFGHDPDVDDSGQTFEEQRQFSHDPDRTGQQS